MHRKIFPTCHRLDVSYRESSTRSTSKQFLVSSRKYFQQVGWNLQRDPYYQNIPDYRRKWDLELFWIGGASDITIPPHGNGYFFRRPNKSWHVYRSSCHDGATNGSIVILSLLANSSRFEARRSLGTLPGTHLTGTGTHCCPRKPFGGVLDISWWPCNQLLRGDRPLVFEAPCWLRSTTGTRYYYYSTTTS